MLEFTLGVLASIIAAVVLMLIPSVRSKFLPFWLLWHQSKDFANLYRSGVLAIHLERNRTNPIDLISSTKSEFVYVGVVPNVDDLKKWCCDCFESLLSSGKNVTLVFWEVNNISDQLLDNLALYYMMSSDHMRKSLHDAWKTVLDFKESLPEHCNKHFKLRYHNRILTDSVFLIDTDTTKNESGCQGRIHLDQKLFGLGKSHATVIKLQQVLNPDSFYDRVLNSFRMLIEQSTAYSESAPANKANAADAKRRAAD